MMRNICCSFDNEHGTVFVTCNNGVHPDKKGHYSNTIVMTRDSFAKAMKDKLLFNEALGIDIRAGWQNALHGAISNCIGLNTELAPETAAKEILAVNVAQRGEDAVKADMEALAVNNDAIEAELKEIVKKKETENGDETGKTRSAKSSKKSRGATADKTPDVESTGSDSESK